MTTSSRLRSVRSRTLTLALTLALTPTQTQTLTLTLTLGPIKAPLGPRKKKGGTLSQEVSMLPTSISGGVTQDVPLRPSLVARLAIAGGLCSAITRGITSPIDLRKTMAQSAKDPSPPPSPPPAVSSWYDAGYRLGGTESTPLAVSEPLNLTAGLVPPPSDAAFDSSLLLGMDASLAAGFASGAASFGTYEYLRRSIPQLAASVLGPAAPADLFTPILFTACLLQSVAASVCSSPFETARVKIMAGAAGAADAPTTLLAALDEIMRAPPTSPAPADATPAATSAATSAAAPAGTSVGVTAANGEAATVHHVEAADPHGATPSEGSALAGDGQREAARLWDGLPALMGRELPFGVTKLLVYASTQDALLSVAPAARERPLFALLVSLASGLVAGSMAGLTSHPADTVVTRLTTGGFGRDWRAAPAPTLTLTLSLTRRAALTDVLSGAESDKPADQAKVLYAGVRQRCLALAIIVTAQFIIFDGLRTLLAVSKDDLSLILDVFEDRLDFYSAWDEVWG